MALVRRKLPELQPVFDILADGHMREERVVLEHGRDRPVIGRQAAHVLAGDVQRRRLGPEFEAADDAEQRRLARAARSEHGDELAFGDRERDMVEGERPAVTVNEVDRFEGGNGAVRCRASSSFRLPAACGPATGATTTRTDRRTDTAATTALRQ